MPSGLLLPVVYTRVLRKIPPPAVVRKCLYLQNPVAFDLGTVNCELASGFFWQIWITICGAAAAFNHPDVGAVLRKILRVVLWFFSSRASRSTKNELAIRLNGHCSIRLKRRRRPVQLKNNNNNNKTEPSDFFREIRGWKWGKQIRS